jgi:alkylation response protein AidB-like acyl-CoA dehydrogenase
MDYEATDYRLKAREWLATHAPKPGAVGEAVAEISRQRAFQGELYAAGFAGITWPVEYGGKGLTNAEQIAFNEEARAYELPVIAFAIGLGMIGPTLLERGTEAQKQQYLRDLLSGRQIWCQLFSEPGAGSDLASLQSTAVAAGDDWILNGQKVWTSGANYSDMGVVIARTDRTSPKHRGITMFIVDMHAPGVTVRPLKVATGAAPFNEVFFDDVRLPGDSVVGEVNAGWDCAVVMLRNERVSIGTRNRARTNPLSYDSLLSSARRLGRTGDPAVQRGLAQLYAREQSVRLFGEMLLEEAINGTQPGARGSAVKLAGSRLASFAVDVAALVFGEELVASDSDLTATTATAMVEALGRGIAGGTNEIQRNIIGERVLGLPKDPGVDRDTPFDQLRVGTQRG